MWGLPRIVVVVLVLVTLGLSCVESLDQHQIDIDEETTVAPGYQILSPGPPNANYFGRVFVDSGAQQDVVMFDWSGVGFQLSFTGSSIFGLYLQDVGNEYDIISEDFNVTLVTNTTSTPVVQILSTGLDSSKTHNVMVFKRTEALFGVVSLFGIVLSPGGSLQPAQPNFNESRRIEFIGDSITCGFGDLGTFPCNFSASTEDVSHSYAELIARELDADIHIVAWSGKGMVRNYGYPNESSPESMPTYFNKTLANSDAPSTTWNFTSWIPSAVVINLGTNDFSTGPVPSQELFESTYVSFISEIRSVYQQAQGGVGPELFLVCGPMIGNPCCQYVSNVADEVGATYIPIQQLNCNNDSTPCGCDGHPNVQGHQGMYELAYPIIQKAMGWY